MTDNQLTSADLAGMSPQQIDQARQEGRLARLLGVADDEIDLRERVANGGTFTRAEARELNRLGLYDAVLEAHRDGRITPDTDDTATEE
jgi:hypothetical protein